MKVSYNWLKWYLPDAPDADKLADIVTYHVAEVESVEKREDGDSIFDIKILPNRAHDLLSHQGIARELASLLNIAYADPTQKYKAPESKPTNLKIEIQTDKCRRYMGRVVRGVKVDQSPEWVVKHLESIGQRSINNLVDAANITMFDCGQPTHIFDLNKVKDKIIVRQAKEGEELLTLDNKQCKFKSVDVVIADTSGPLGVAGVKGGKSTEVDTNTKNIIIEVANFDPTSVRKTAQALNIFTDARKRFENDLSPELVSFGMLELSALIAEMCPEATFEDVVDVYPQKQLERKLSFSLERISKILGLEVSVSEVEDILKRYNFEYKNQAGKYEIIVPPLRLDLVLEEDIAEEIGRVLGYDKVKPVIPKINFKTKANEVYSKIVWARNKLLSEGYSEVMNTSFTTKGEVSVLASASDKNFLRTNLSDGLKESLKLNKINAPLLGIDEVKIFEIGTVFKNAGEEMHIAYGDKKEIKEVMLDDFTKSAESFLNGLAGVGDPGNRGPEKTTPPMKFNMWSLFPFIARDVAVWVGEGISSDEVLKVIQQNAGNLVVRGPELFDQYKKDGKISYAFRLVFQSYDRTLTDTEISEIMNKISEKLKQNGWEVR